MRVGLLCYLDRLPSSCFRVWFISRLPRLHTSPILTPSFYGGMHQMSTQTTNDRKYVVPRDKLETNFVRSSGAVSYSIEPCLVDTFCSLLFVFRRWRWKYERSIMFFYTLCIVCLSFSGGTKCQQSEHQSRITLQFGPSEWTLHLLTL